MRRLAYSLAALAVVLGTAGGAANIWVDWEHGHRSSVVFDVAFTLMGVTSALTGAVVASRVPRNSVGWIILTFGLGVGVMLSTGVYADISVRRDRPLPMAAAASLVSDTITIPLFFGVIGFLLLLFPTGRPLSRRWAGFGWFFGITVGIAAACNVVVPRELGSGLANPLALHGASLEVAKIATSLTNVTALPAMVICAVALAQRLRRAQGVQRQQVKWFTYAACLSGVCLGTTVLANGPAAALALLLGVVGMVLLPVTAGIAIVRHRLYDIDVVINKTIVYAALTATLVVVYLASVLLLRLAIEPITGGSDLAVAASTLAVAALFRPLRARIQKGVDRRFYRRRYDAVQTLQTFTSRLRQEVDLNTVSADLRTVVRDTVQPAHVTLWLRGASDGAAVTISERPRSRKVSP